MKTKVRYFADLTISLLLLGIVWQVYVNQAKVPSFMLPNPVVSIQELLKQLGNGNTWLHIGITGLETFSGFTLATLLGMSIGYFVYKYENVRITLMPFLIFFQVAPKIALVPLFIIWFGLGFLSKIIVVGSMVLFPVIIGMIEGLNAIPKDILDYMSILKATKSQILWQVELRYALPSLFSAFKIGIVQALIGAIVAEWMSGQSGLGFLQTYSASTFNTPLLIASILLTVLLGLIFYGIIDFFEKKLLT